MVKINAVVADFESIYLQSSDVSYVHTISLIPVTMHTGKMSQYRLHTEKGLVIKVSDVLQNKFVKEFLEASRGVEHVDRKHACDAEACRTHGIKVIRVMRFHDAFKAMIKYVVANGGVLMSHNLLSDLQALVDTQNFVKGRRIIKNKLVQFPNTGVYDKRWSDIKLVCTMSLFCNRCPKMTGEYKKWSLANGKTVNRGMNRLESFKQFVRKEPGYRQTHAAVQDTIDLFTVLMHAFKSDGPIIDGHTYLNEPKWLKVV
jgi:hypothetical protein